MPVFNRQNLQHDFSKAAKHYDANAKLQLRVLANAVTLASEYWPAGSMIADIGSGTGILDHHVKEQGLKWQITGCDLAAGMCRYAKEKGYRTINADAQKLPFKSNIFDGVFSSLMMQWANNPAEVFKECYDIIKPGRYAVMTTFTKGSLTELQQAFSEIDDKPHTSNFKPMLEWVPYAASAGFAVKKMQEKTIREYYPDTRAIMHAIKAIGAGNKRTDSKTTALTKSQLRTIEQYYRDHFSHDDGLMVTWKILTLLLHKA